MYCPEAAAHFTMIAEDPRNPQNGWGQGHNQVKPLSKDFHQT
jgi:hypothetical protein